MRILIANHIDDSLMPKADQRMFTHRVLWLAQEGDLIVMCAAPDPLFVAYVCGLTGVDPTTLKFQVAPPGRFTGKVLDPHALTDDGFIARVARDIDPVKVTAILPFWPSAQITQFAERLDIRHCFEGAGFFAQGGDALANSKPNFRALAASCDVPIAEGAVCRTAQDMKYWLEVLLAKSDAVMIKQAYNGTGVGNLIVRRDESLATGHAGARHVLALRSLEQIKELVEHRWNWASCDGRFPVVVELFQPASKTIYAEFYSSDVGVEHTESGALVYVERRLVEEIAPLRDVPLAVQQRLVNVGYRLALKYHAMGYRGYMSADAIVDEQGHLVLTEMNARVGGSLHIYKGIAHRVVDVWREPQRTVIQYLTPKHWRTSGQEFLGTANDLGITYDSTTRKGVILAVPTISGVLGGNFMFCVAYASETEHRDTYRRLDSALSQAREV